MHDVSLGSFPANFIAQINYSSPPVTTSKVEPTEILKTFRPYCLITQTDRLNNFIHAQKQTNKIKSIATIESERSPTKFFTKRTFSIPSIFLTPSARAIPQKTTPTFPSAIPIYYSALFINAHTIRPAGSINKKARNF